MKAIPIKTLSLATAVFLSLALSATLIASPAAVNDAQAQQQNVAAASSVCSPLMRTSTGREITAAYSAAQFSKQRLGDIGISIYPGKDLGKHSPDYLGSMLVTYFKNKGVNASCFIDNNPNSNGTAVNFHVDGMAVNGDRPYGIAAALDKTKLDVVVAEAKTARLILNK